MSTFNYSLSSNYYRNYSEYLGSRRCCNTKVVQNNGGGGGGQGPQGP
jgi:hypothetical protein